MRCKRIHLEKCGKPLKKQLQTSSKPHLRFFRRGLRLRRFRGFWGGMQRSRPRGLGFKWIWSSFQCFEWFGGGLTMVLQQILVICSGFCGFLAGSFWNGFVQVPKHRKATNTRTPTTTARATARATTTQSLRMACRMGSVPCLRA